MVIQYKKNYHLIGLGVLVLIAGSLLFIAKGRSNAAADDPIHTAYQSSGLTTTNPRGCYTESVLAASQCSTTTDASGENEIPSNYSVCGNQTSEASHKCTSGKLLDSSTPPHEVDWSPGEIIDCNTCVVSAPGCNTTIDTGNFTTNCRYSNCTRTSGTKTCDKNSDAPSTCGASQSWTTDASGSPIICPTACDSSTQTSAYQYHCTTDGKKTKVYTSTAGNCRPSADEIENCVACTDGSGGSTNQYTSCLNWPGSCPSGSSSVTIQCGVPSTAQCAPTQQGQSTFTSGATRPKTKNCCTLNDYTQSCSQGSTTEVNAPAVPSYTYSAALKSGIDCVALPSTSLATSCCVADVKSCTAWQCVRDGDGGKNRRDCTPYACKADKSGFNSAGAKITEDGTSCSSASCSSGDYESAESVVVPCTANSTPTTQGTEKFGKKKKTGITCNGASWIDERSVACCTQNSWTCGYSPDCGDSNGGQTITQTCTINTCTYSSSATTPDNSKPEPSKSSKYCPDRNASQVGGSLPDGADGNTLRYYSGGWSSNSFLKNIGSAIGIGVGAANPNGLLEISNASNTTVTARARITDITHNPELQLQYGTDSEFTPNQHWGLYVANSGTANDKSLRIWNQNDLVKIDTAGKLHAAQFCIGLDDTKCVSDWGTTGGSGGITVELDPKVGTLTNGKWCSTDGLKISCTNDSPITAEQDPKVGVLTAGRIPKWGAFTLEDGVLFQDTNNRIGIGTLKPSMLLTIAGTGQNPTNPTSCPAGTEWINENGDTTRDNGECKPFIALNPDTGVLRITKNAGAGKVLVSDVNGNGTWKVFSAIPDGTAQGQTLWWDNTDNVKKWIVDNKLTIDKSGSVGIGAVTPAEFETSRFVVKGDDPLKTNGMYVSLQGSDTVISTTPPPSAWGVAISFAATGANDSFTQTEWKDSDVKKQKLVIKYYVTATGTKSLQNPKVTDEKCTSVKEVKVKVEGVDYNKGDASKNNKIDPGGGDPGKGATPAEWWVFTCTINDLTAEFVGTATSVTSKATVTADKVGESGTVPPAEIQWKAEKKKVGNYQPAGAPAAASAVAQPAAQPESTSSGIVPATPAGAGSLAPAAPAGPAPAWGGAQ